MHYRKKKVSLPSNHNFKIYFTFFCPFVIPILFLPNFYRLNDSKAKWWLYLFRISEQFIIEKLFTVEELITTLQKFVTNSNVAEFHARLDLLYTFHCFAVNFKQSGHKKEAGVYQNVLWNLYQYYDQFRACVTVKIGELRAPVEKKLKDYVKIVKWKDISYWSVKETVDKSHKILHKHVREFKVRENLKKKFTTWQRSEFLRSTGRLRRCRFLHLFMFLLDFN